MAIAGALVASAAISAGASIYGASQTSSGRPDWKSLRTLFHYSDFPGSAGLDAYIFQNMVGMGLGLDSLQQEFVLSRIEQNNGPSSRRGVNGLIDGINQSLVAGNTHGANRLLGRLNHQLTLLAQRKRGKYTGLRGSQAPAVARISGGQLSFRINDPTWDSFERAWEDSGIDPDAIFTQRLRAQGDIVNFGKGLTDIIGSEGIQGLIDAKNAQLNMELDERVSEMKKGIYTEANRYDLDPTGRLRELDERVIILKHKIETEDAIRSGTLLASGVATATAQGIAALKSSLQPVGPLQVPTGQVDPDTAANLAIANAQADAARNASIANTFGGLSQGLLQAAINQGTPTTTTTPPGQATGSNALQNQLGANPWGGFASPWSPPVTPVGSTTRT